MFNKIIFGTGILILSFVTGWFVASSKQTCPACDIMDIPQPTKEAYCNISEPKTITEYVPRYIKTKCPVCDTAPDYEEGRVQGWQECTHAEQMNPIKKEIKEECKGVCAIPRIQRR